MGWKEQGKKRYNKLVDVEGLSPTLRPSALMKNSQENIIVNQPKEKKEPTGNQQNFVVSGQMSGTSTQPKSTGEGLGIKIVGNVGNGHEAQNVYDPEGIAPTVRENHGKTTKVVTGTKQKRGKTISPNEIYPTLQSEDQRKFNSNQSIPVDTGTNPQNSTRETSEQLTLLPYQTTTSSVRDFLAKVSQLLGSEEDLQILEAHSSLRYAESYRLSDLRFYSLRMSEDSSPMMQGILTKPSSERWMSWGMTVSGKCLTASTTESRRTESGCSLSDILEDNPGQKYFLSEKQTKYIQNQIDKSPTPLTAIITKDG